MAYIGAVAPGYDPTRASVPQLDAERFSGDATTTAFTLTRQVVSPTDIDVIVENVTQEPTVAYSVNGYTLTFTGAPGVGTNNIYVIYRASGISNYAFVPDGSITFAKLANNIKQFTVDAVTANGTGTTVELTEAPASANSIIVSVDGVIQTAPSNYTLSGSTITFTGVPNNGANVVVRHIGFRTTSTVTALQASSVTATEIADGSITNVKIVSVANTKITGNIVSSQITSVANTQITGNIISSQITSVANTQLTGNVISSQIEPNQTFYGNVSVTGNLSATGGITATGITSKIQPITASAAANALTITLNPTILDFRSATLTNGTVTTITVPAAISVTISSGSTLGTVSATQSRIVVIALNNAGTIELAAVNISGGTQLDETNLISTTAEGGAGAADSSSVVYSTTARTSVAYRVVGYIESTQATAGTWATAPSTIQGVGGQALSAMSSLGYSQTWQVLTGSRALTTTYYNTTGRPIFVNIQVQATTNGTNNLTINGVIACQTVSSASLGVQVSGVVPPGGSYSADSNQGSKSLISWSELR